MHRATSKFLCLYSQIHALATSETIKGVEYKNIACVENIFVQSFSLGCTCFYERVSLRNWRHIVKQQFGNFQNEKKHPS